MASTSYSCAFVLSSLLAISLFTPSSGDQREDLIYSVCHKTADPQFCIALFDKNVPQGSASVHSLASVTIRQSLIKATDTGIFVKRLISSSTKPLKDLYAICDVTFQVITNEYIEIQLLFAQNNYREVLKDVEKTERPVNDCLYNVKVNADLSKMTLDMKALIDMSHVIVGLL